MGSMFDDYLIISYVTCIFALVAFAAYAVGRYTLQLRAGAGNKDLETFVTARHSQPVHRIAWSFFAGAVGAWVIVSPAQYATYAGAIGVAMYSFSSGIPILIIALTGDKLQRKFPAVLSIGDFAMQRFGPTAKTIVMFITLFNMSIAMIAEYTTMGSLFQVFVGSVNYPIIIVSCILTMTYTAYGGLSISIITDQLQGGLTLLLVAVLSTYMGVTFRGGLDANFEGPNKEYLGVNIYGYSSIIAMPLSLTAATVFSEAMWQRVWASQDRRALLLGAALGGSAVIVVVFFFCMCGMLALWAGYISYDYYVAPLSNAVLFTAFRDESQGSVYTVHSWIGVVTLILAVTMHESAVDSLQNGLAASISAHFFKRKSVWYARVAVLLINAPLIIIACQGYSVLSLFLVTNLLCVCCFLPVALGIFDGLKPYLTESAVISGCTCGVLTLTAYGIGKNWVPGDAAASFMWGAYMAWMGNNYLWDYFLVAICFSIAGMLLWIIPAQILKRSFGIEGPGISGVLRYTPAWKYITGTYGDDEEVQPEVSKVEVRADEEGAPQPEGEEHFQEKLVSA